MRASAGRLRAAALLLLSPLAPAAAQTATPNLFLEAPPRSHLLVELTLSGSRPGAFVAENGDVEKFPGSLAFGLGVLSVSWAPIAHFAVGVEAPYRTYRFQPDGFDAATSGSGSPGVGVFADWAPSAAKAPLAVNARVGAFFARSASGLPLGTADGLNRYSLAGQLTTPSSGGLLEGWRGDLVADVEFGPTKLSADSFFESQIFLRAGPRLARLGAADLELLAVGGFRFANAGREEANRFHDLQATNFVAGGMLDAVWSGSRDSLSRAVVLSVTRQFAVKEALDGWRATLTLRAGL